MRKNRRGRRSLTRVKWLGAILLLVVAVFAGLRLGSDGAGFSPLASEKNIEYMMIMGVDRRADDVGRSDTLMVAALDQTEGKAALLSIPRDTLVPMEKHDYDKVNHAYAYGGHELTQKTVENLLGVPMTHYVLIDTRAFQKIIDAIGGVDLEVEKRMYYEDPWDDNGGLVIDLYPGEQHLDGDKAIQYVRYRDGEGDIGRVRRQQKFMRALLSAVISPEIFPRLPKIIEEVRSSVETDMSAAELVTLAKMLKDMSDEGLATQMVPGRPAFADEISYWVPDLTEVRALLPEALGLTLSEKETAENEKAEEKYLKGLPKGLKYTEGAESAKDTKDAKQKDSAKDTKDAKDAKKDEKKDEQRTMKPSEISVLVINESGINGAGAAAAEVLAKKGFIISSVETGKTSSRQTTTVTTSAGNTELFYGMPFPLVIMDGGSADQAVLRIGLDYRR